MNKLLITSYILLIIFPIISCTDDHTLKPEHYQKLGMPSYKKVWTNDDYIACNITLSSLKMNDPLSLPRKSSRKSGVLFKRMVNIHNLDFIYDKTFPLRTRAYTIQYFTRFQTEIEQMYTIEHNGKQYYGEELLDIHIFGLQVHDRMLELAMIINDSDDPDTDGIKSGMTAVEYNYMKLIPRLIGELARTEQYSETDRKRLASAISSSIKSNIKWMSDNDKASLKGFLSESTSTIGSEAIKDILAETAKIL